MLLYRFIEKLHLSIYYDYAVLVLMGSCLPCILQIAGNLILVCIIEWQSGGLWNVISHPPPFHAFQLSIIRPVDSNEIAIYLSQEITEQIE